MIQEMIQNVVEIDEDIENVKLSYGKQSKKIFYIFNEFQMKRIEIMDKR